MLSLPVTHSITPLAKLPPVTALVLCGGQGRRMGGVDKGLQAFGGQPLAQRALQRLRAQSLPPAAIGISANRHLDVYARWGLPVWPDETPGFAGPLAGMLTGLRHCATPWLLTVPCDVPHFPLDLCARMASALHARPDAQLAVACLRADGQDAAPPPRPQPVFSLLRRSLLPDLAAHVQAGGRKAGAWMASQAHVRVVFEREADFANINTTSQLQALAPEHARLQASDN